MVPRPKKPPKAKFAANQEALDRLAEKRSQQGDGSSYQYTLKKAMDSLSQCTEPITSYKQALELKFVGSHIATIICPPNATLEKRANNKLKNSEKSLGNHIEKSVASETSDLEIEFQGVKSIALTRRDGPKRKNAESIPILIQQNLDENDPRSIAAKSKLPPAKKRRRNATVNKDDTTMTTKEKAYVAAVSDAMEQKHFNKGLTWRVILIIDGREQQSQHIIAKCQMSGIPCEQRMLPIGDMAWIAQAFHAGEKGNVVTEIMLGTIIERKTCEDLKNSLFGTRYHEQRLRLQNCGLQQVLFIIEGNMSKELFLCSSETLHTAVWETRLNLNFSIVHTSHMDETVVALKRMHRRIIQRAFPKAFYDEALPSFQEVYSSATTGYQIDEPSTNDQRIDSTPQRKRRRRRRLQSLMEMTFDTDPIPPLGTDRFITYQELKAKVQRDREAGTRTVGSIHRAMLKQVATLSVTKCQAVARMYPTLNRLMQDYYLKTRSTSAKQALTADIAIRDPNLSIENHSRTIGPRSSAELCIAYSTTDSSGQGETNVLSEDQGCKQHIPTKSDEYKEPPERSQSSTFTSETGMPIEPSKKDGSTDRSHVLRKYSSTFLDDECFASMPMSRSESPVSNTSFNCCVIESPEPAHQSVAQAATIRFTSKTHFEAEESTKVLSSSTNRPVEFSNRILHRQISRQETLPVCFDLTDSPGRKVSSSIKSNSFEEGNNQSSNEKENSHCPPYEWYTMENKVDLDSVDDSPYSYAKPRQMSELSKKSYRSSMSSGCFTETDNCPLDKLQQYVSSDTRIMSTKYERVDAVTFSEAKGTPASSLEMQRLKKRPSSLMKSLHDALYSSDEDDGDTLPQRPWLQKSIPVQDRANKMETSSNEKCYTSQIQEVIEID